MTKEEKDLVTDFVSKTLGTPASEAASLLFNTKEDGSADLKESAITTLLQKDADRVKTFKDAETKAHDKGYKKAQVEVLEKFESEVKAKFGISSDEKGVSLIESVVKSKVSTDGAELDEEKVKRSSFYLSTVERLKKEKEEAIGAESGKFTELETKIKKESIFKTVTSTAKEIVRELNPILPEGKNAEGKQKADIQIEKLLNELGSEYEFEIKDGKTLVSKNGKLLEDAHGNMIDFKEIVKAKASDVWDFKEGTQRQSAGNNNDAGSGNKSDGNKVYTGPVPTNQDEYMKLMGDAKDDNTKMEITKVWNGQNKM